ncbi:hypothetical protein HPB48_010719 [Haemaphysalis longicornis]|uniref:F-box domain-containing protein n=1 Tax=Haemaphysalis longicornis TaxID=44386 RepID=A0A9J6G541_HAELO|nr:hypothetical protein HPB48_010719 [Haemaphysalis longicornis]
MSVYSFLIACGKKQANKQRHRQRHYHERNISLQTLSQSIDAEEEKEPARTMRGIGFAMEFDDLPFELVLMIFSYLPQEILEEIIRVSQRWMQLALDPSLLTTVCIDPWLAANPQRVRKTLERATMLHSLYITTEVVDWDIIASASTGFPLLNCLVIPGGGFSHRAMPAILEHSEVLTTIVLWGRYRLAANDVRTLETGRSLKRIVTSDHLQIHDDALYQICCSCPRHERLKLDLKKVSRSKSCTCVKGLRHLRHLSVSVIFTAGSIQVSKSCPGLATLEIGSVWNESDVSMAQPLQGFLQLKSLRLIHGYGEWLQNRKIHTPPFLKRFEVPGLVMDMQPFYQLMLSFRKTLRHIHIEVSKLPGESLRVLRACKKPESLRVQGLSGNTIVFSNLHRLPRLLAPSFHIVADPAEAVCQLRSIVDAQDRSPRGKTRLVLNIVCGSHDAHVKIRRAANAFVDCLTLNTFMTTRHILELEGQFSTGGEFSYLPWKLETSWRQ